jgi:hypothetical protein
VCSVGSTCVECIADSDCRSGDSQHCDTLLGRCVDCTSDAQCRAPARCALREGDCISP